MRIDEDGADDSCRHYAKLARISHRECQILKASQDRFEESLDELKSEHDEVKVDLRASNQENLNMQTKIFDLESENKRMQESLQSSDQENDQNIRLQVEQEMQPKIDFKE